MDRFLDQKALLIPLKEWMDPQGNPLLIDSEHLTLVYFKCWNEAGDEANYVGKLTFLRGWASRSMYIDHIPYRYEPKGHSWILEIPDSRWLDEVISLNERMHPGFADQRRKEFRHYVVGGHDGFVEVIATGFEESTESFNDVEHILPFLS